MKLIAVGAYGRPTRQKDWDDGKDFRIYPDGPYFSNRDVKKLKLRGFSSIEFKATLGPVVLFTVKL